MLCDEPMQTGRFSCDYYLSGTEPTARRILTNPGEWIRSSENAGVLRLCGVAENRIGKCASDFDFFAALCESLPHLTGHPLEKQLCRLFRGLLGIDPRREDAKMLWKAASAWLSEHDMTRAGLLEQLGCTAGELHSLSAPFPTDGGTVFSAETLTSALSLEKPVCWDAWERAAEELLTPWHAGCRAVRFELPRGYCYRRPNRYRAECFLNGTETSEEATALWTAQLFRFWASWAKRCGVPLLLVADGAGKEAACLLDETERAVGLPSVVWIAEDSRTVDAMVEFSMQEHTAPIDRALPLLRYPSDVELRAALERAAARTPLGRLQAVTGGAWSAIPYERERFLSLLAVF